VSESCNLLSHSYFFKHTTPLVKPKFNYVNFATESQIFSRTQIMKVFNTNHAANFCDLGPQQNLKTLLPGTLLPTFPVHCKFHYSDINGFVTDFVANILTCRDGLCLLLSPWASFGESRRNEIWAGSTAVCSFETVSRLSLWYYSLIHCNYFVTSVYP